MKKLLWNLLNAKLFFYVLFLKIKEQSKIHKQVMFIFRHQIAVVMIQIRQLVSH
jgi:hypothetical protein